MGQKAKRKLQRFQLLKFEARNAVPVTLCAQIQTKPKPVFITTHFLSFLYNPFPLTSLSHSPIEESLLLSLSLSISLSLSTFSLYLSSSLWGYSLSLSGNLLLLFWFLFIIRILCLNSKKSLDLWVELLVKNSTN